MTIKDELDEMMQFENCKIIRTRQYDGELHIAHYTIGEDKWVTLFEDYDGENNFTRVNINSTGLTELLGLLKGL